MSIIYVPSGGDLQSAIDRAQPGDDVVVKDRTAYPGGVRIPPKNGRVTLRSESVFHERVTAAQAEQMARISSGSSAPAIDGTDTANWLIQSVRGEPNTFSEVVRLQNATNVTIEGFALIVPDGQEQKRGILANGNSLKIARSHIEGVRRPGQDSQGIASWEGDGLDIIDNFIEAASENVLIGGADPSSEAAMSRNVRIIDNHLFKRLAWKTGLHQVKNAAEFKAVLKALFIGNILENVWAAPDGQPGFGLVITPRNQDGKAPWARIEDLEATGNTFINCERGVNLTGYDDIHQSGQTTRIRISDNDMDVRGLGFLMHKELGTVAVYRNKIRTTNAALSFEALSASDLWKTGEAAPRKARYGVESLTWAENETEGYIHSPMVVGYPGTPKAAEAFAAYVKQPVSLTVPNDVPTPPEPPQPPVTPVPVPVPDPTAAKLKAVLDYLAAMPKFTRIEQMRAYLRAVPK